MNNHQKYYQDHKEDYKKNFQNYKNNNYEDLKAYNRKKNEERRRKLGIEPKIKLPIDQKLANDKLSTKNWRKNNPEKLLIYQKKYLLKISNSLKKSIFSLHWALHTWSLSVRKRDNHICQNCGKPAKEAHHIFPKSKYPGLALNINNGISLCLFCHWKLKYNVS